MFEPQDHPNDFAYPGGPPVRPYDSAGYTLAFQMAVKFDRVLDGFDGPFEEIKDLVVAPPPARVLDAEGAVGFFLAAHINDSFRAVNRLQKAGEEVRRLQAPIIVEGVTLSAGDLLHHARTDDAPAAGEDRRRDRHAVPGQPDRAPARRPSPLKPARIALWDRYGGSMPSGWTRWLLEQFEFPFQVVYAPELDKGGLRDKFDVLILVDGAYAVRGGPDGGGRAEWRRRPARRGGGRGERAAGRRPPAAISEATSPRRSPCRT